MFRKVSCRTQRSVGAELALRFSRLRDLSSHFHLPLALDARHMMQFPKLPRCNCEMHSESQGESACPASALDDPFLYLPPSIDFTSRMQTIAERYLAHDIDWRYYPAFQAAAFLKPKTAEQHEARKTQFFALKGAAESEGFVVPESLTRLYTTDAYIDRLHHNGVWPSLPEKLTFLPADPRFAVLLFLIEGQGCGIWHLLLAPNGEHRVINASGRFGCVRGYPPGHSPDFGSFEVYACMDSINRFLYHYFKESTLHDKQYVERIAEYFAENPS